MRLIEPEIDPTQTETQERLALLDRVSRSPQLRRASRLRELLLYIGKQSIELGKTELHEQEIGTAVFGRPPHYDTSQDNIVRVNATELRKRLESYFATDGTDEIWVLEIPRGGYCPVFSRRKVPVPASGESELQRNVSELITASPGAKPLRRFPRIISRRVRANEDLFGQRASLACSASSA